MRADILDILRCPVQGGPLVALAPAEVEACSEGLRSGRLALQSGGIPRKPLTAVLENPAGPFRYPVIDGIPFLLPERAIVDAADGQLGENTALEAEYQAQMEIYSGVYDDVNADLLNGLRRYLQENYYSRCVGQDVLDVGNGGESAEVVLGKEIAGQVGRFIGLDKSYPMLARVSPTDDHVLGDALKLPFADNSFDYVFVNLIIHHLGVERGEPLDTRVAPFLRECLRVARKGIILLEMVVPAWGEWGERLLIATALRRMATFVFSADTLTSMLAKHGMRLQAMRHLPLTHFVPPLSVMPPVVFLNKFRLPACLIPYEYVFGVIEK